VGLDVQVGRVRVQVTQASDDRSDLARVDSTAYHLEAIYVGYDD
jgi:hypothetical protein